MDNDTESMQRSYSTTGRPRRLTDAQIAEILQWYQSRLTNSQMAERYGIARGTLESTTNYTINVEIYLFVSKGDQPRIDVFARVLVEHQ